MTRLFGAACAAVLVASATAETRAVARGPHAVAVPAAAMGSQACRVTPHRTLETFLPVMPGWTRGDPVSETDTVESVSRTTVDYDRDVSTISVEIMDSCRNPDVLGPLTTALKQGVPVTRGTTTKSLAVQGFPACEEWTAEAGNGEVHVLVGGRFMVKVTGATTDLRTLENTPNLMALQRLAALP
jgi:hypothetical protein